MINVVGLQEKNELDANEDLRRKLEHVMAQLAELKGGSMKDSNVKKNQVAGKAQEGRTYFLLSKRMEGWGKVPEQQANIAAILSTNMEVGVAYTEAEVFGMINEHKHEYPKLRNSVQDATYLFRYYRGLKKDGKHAGFIARNFLRMVG